MTAEPSRSQDHARVTICLICYQHAEFVQQALDAIAAQTCQAFKVIAIDDGSTDGTLAILQNAALGSLNGKLTVLTHPGHQNQGCYASYRECLRHVDTDYFLPHASDDFLEPDAVEGLIALLDANPNADFAYGPCKVVDTAGRSLDRIDGVVDIGRGPAAIRQLLAANPVREPTMFFRRRCREVFLDYPTFVRFGDWFYHFHTFSLSSPLRYETPYVNYRIHGSNVSIGQSRAFLLREIRAVFEALMRDDLPVHLQPYEGLLTLCVLSHRAAERCDRSADSPWRQRLASANWTAVADRDWGGLPGRLLDLTPSWVALRYCTRVHWPGRFRELMRVLRRVAARMIRRRSNVGS